MFSLATRALRAVPRAKPIRAFASTSVSRAPPQSTPVDELIVAIDETQDRIQDEQPQNPEVSSRLWDPSQMHPVPMYRPVTPNLFSAKERFKVTRYKKRAYLGPSGPESRSQDIFHQLHVDPMQESFNSNLLSAWVSDMGKIKNRAETGLTWRSQRRLSKAIRRAKMMGIMPLHSKRPLLQGY